MKLLLISVALFTLPAQVVAEDLVSVISKANESYEQAEFSAAKVGYEQAVAEGLDDGQLYYNLGNTYFRLGKIGYAILFLRRALAQYPRDPDIRANLELARKNATDAFEGDEAGNEARGIQALLGRFLILNRLLSREELKVGFLVCYVVFWGAFALAGFRRSLALQTLTQIAGFVVVLLGVSFFLVSPSRDGTQRLSVPIISNSRDVGVIVQPKVKAYSGNSENFQVVFVLHDGAEVEVGERRGDFVEIILPQGRRGWVKTGEVAII